MFYKLIPSPSVPVKWNRDEVENAHLEALVKFLAICFEQLSYNQIVGTTPKSLHEEMFRLQMELGPRLLLCLISSFYFLLEIAGLKI